jgi:outer membrane protein
VITIFFGFISTVSASENALTLNPYSPWYAQNFSTGWHIDTVVGFEVEPTYAGSDKRVTELDAGIRAVYRTKKGHRYFVNLGELGAIVNLSPNMQFLAFFEFEEGRTDEDDSTLTGMDEIDSTVEGQFSLSRRWGNSTLFATLQPDLLGDANKGLVWFVGASHSLLTANDRWRLSLAIDLSGGDSEYMKTEFGVTESESDRTGLNAFEPGSGLKSLTWTLDSEYYFNDSFSILGGASAECYLGDTVNSPLIADEGSDFTVEASLLARWRF